MCRAEGAVDLVISCHYRPRITIPDSNLERLKSDFAKGSIGDLFVNKKASRFLVIGCKMLDASADAGPLETTDEFSSNLACQERIFAVGFEVAAAEWCSRNTDYDELEQCRERRVQEEWRTRRPEKDVNLFALGLVNQDATDILDDREIPSSC